MRCLFVDPWGPRRCLGPRMLASDSLDVMVFAMCVRNGLFKSVGFVFGFVLNLGWFVMFVA